MSCSDEKEAFDNTVDALSEGVGEACIDDAEEFPDFSGFSKEEISISESTCEYGRCVAYHFQGRASCPEGQTEVGSCTTPSGEPVTVPVQPQLEDRPSDKNVFCSCRCDGPDDGPFCKCPGGYSCEPLIENLGFDDGWAGSYCMPVDVK